MPSPYGFGNSSIKGKMLAYSESRKGGKEVAPETELVKEETPGEVEEKPEEGAESSVTTAGAEESDEEPVKTGIFSCCFG